MDEPSNANLALTSEIVAAYVGNHVIAAADLPDLISSVFKSLAKIGEVETPTPEKPQPAVQVKKSVHKDFLVCLEDGKKLKMLKRHLKTNYNLSPEDYRRKWGLPSDYPMVAPAYAEQRSSLAKKIGLGRKRSAQPSPEPVAPARRRSAGGRTKAA